VRDSGKAKGRIDVSTIASEKAEREATTLHEELSGSFCCIGDALAFAERPLEDMLRTWCGVAIRWRSLQILVQVPVRLKAGLESYRDLEILTCWVRPFLFTCDTSIMTMSKHHLKDCVWTGVLNRYSDLSSA
jgi:hypothetical protein